VYLSVLKPSDSFYKEVKAPIFVLFGDIHNSSENECVSCSCNIDKKSCCYEVYSYDFLRLIDNKASPKYPIDFSIESGLTSFEAEYKKEYDTEEYFNKIKESAIYPLRKLREGISICYNKEAKIKAPDLYNRLCPTRNIRWQLADSRQQTYGKYIFDRFLWGINHVFGVFELIEEENIDTEIKVKLEDVELDITDTNQIIKYLNILRHITKEDFYTYIDKDTSAIFKQIRKMEEPGIRDKWEEWVNEYYKYIYSTIKPKHSYDYITKVLNKIIDILIEYYKSNKDEKHITELIDYCRKIKEETKDGKYGFYMFFDIRGFIGDVSLIGLDLYFLTRSFKKPEGSEKPLVSFGYFGATHCKNIKHFLLNIMRNYTDVYTQDNSNYEGTQPNRCLEITKHVNLDELINHYQKL
jgi:predicted transcriptional regulator